MTVGVTRETTKRCNRCGTLARPGELGRWAQGRTALTGGQRLCPACHARLSARRALAFGRGVDPR